MSGVRILGIDPGLRRTGWGVILQEGNKLVFIASGVISAKETLTLAERLCALHEGLQNVLTQFQPQEAAVEETFVNVNPDSTLKLGHARGIAMLTPALAGLPVAEYAANLVKKTVVGSGHAAKEQVSHMVGMLLPKADLSSEDATDALAIAICHAHHRKAVKISRAGGI